MRVCWEDFFFVFLSQPLPVGEPAPGTLTSLHAWAEVTWGVLPSTICDGPKFQNRLQFSKSKAQGNQGNDFPGASLILFVHIPFMQIGQTPTAKLCAAPLHLKGLLSAFLISQCHTVWMVASWLRTDNVFSVLYIKHTKMNSYRSSPFLPASRKELRQLFSSHKPHL